MSNNYYRFDSNAAVVSSSSSICDEEDDDDECLPTEEEFHQSLVGLCISVQEEEGQGQEELPQIDYNKGQGNTSHNQPPKIEDESNTIPFLEDHRSKQQSQILKDGILERKGNLLSGWKQGYYILYKNGMLLHYGTEKACQNAAQKSTKEEKEDTSKYNVSRLVDIRKDCRQSDTASTPKQKNMYFRMTFNFEDNTIHKFRAKTLTEQNEWIDASHKVDLSDQTYNDEVNHQMSNTFLSTGGGKRYTSSRTTAA